MCCTTARSKASAASLAVAYLPRYFFLRTILIRAMNPSPILDTPVYPVAFLDDSFLFWTLILSNSNETTWDRRVVLARLYSLLLGLVFVVTSRQAQRGKKVWFSESLILDPSIKQHLSFQYSETPLFHLPKSACGGV